MQTLEVDSVVIGSGPGGEGAAMCLSKADHRVALVEKHVQVGGGCTHWGTIPSKSLRHYVRQLADYRRDPILRRIVNAKSFEYPDVLKGAESVMRQQVDTREGYYFRNHIDMIEGHARFVDAHTVEALSSTEPQQVTQRIVARNFVIATGSRPYHPDNLDFSHPRVCDSDSVLRLDYHPRTVLIYGAGVIGCEYASIFAHLGCKVTLINTRNELLSFLDAEITDALGYHLRNLGVLIYHNETFRSVETTDTGVEVHLESGKRARGDLLLWANGRSGNTEEMNLETLGIAINGRGHIEIDPQYRTAVENIYAVGDVVGWPSLASASYDQGRFAGMHIAYGKSDSRLVEHMPTGIYTSPEISSVGATERELTEQKIPYGVGRAFFRQIARAQITNQSVGVLKLLFHVETLELLGIHCFGEQAAEIVHIGQAIMAQPGEGNTIRYFVETTFNYPTMAEAYRVAALNGLNRLR